MRRSDKQKIAAWFKAKNDTTNLPMPDADYNIDPTTHQPIIRQSKEANEREMVLARWCLVPFFMKELTEIKGLSTINGGLRPFRLQVALTPIGIQIWLRESGALI